MGSVPVSVLDLLTLDEGLGHNPPSCKVRIADIKTGVENRDPDPTAGEAGGRHLGGLQAPSEFPFNKRGNGFVTGLSRCHPGQGIVEMIDRIAVALQVI